MPHECTTCGRTFADGSKEMLSGCPDCGGNKFQYHPGSVSEGSSDDGVTARDSTATVEETTTVEDSTDSSFEFGSSAGSTSGDEPQVVDDARSGDNAQSEDDARSEGDVRPGEDRAQTSARSTVVSEEELALSSSDDPSETAESGDGDLDAGGDIDSDAGESTPDSGDAGPPDSGDPDSPDLSELREELNEQFESIKIHARGEYELNLMELYDREEHIIALEEDGRYVIDVPNSWREHDEES